jgi:hypothetical protein
MIAASCDILQDTFSSVTELSRPVREPMCWVCPCDGCIVLLWTELSRAPVWCAHEMGVSFSSV